MLSLPTNWAASTRPPAEVRIWSLPDVTEARNRSTYARNTGFR